MISTPDLLMQSRNKTVEPDWCNDSTRDLARQRSSMHECGEQSNDRNVFLFVLIAVVIYYFLDRMPAWFRVPVSVAAFVTLSGLSTLVMQKIGDQVPSNAITVRQETMKEGARPKKD